MGSKKILQDNQFLSTHFDSEPKLNIWGPAGTLVVHWKLCITTSGGFNNKKLGLPRVYEKRFQSVTHLTT